MKHFLLALSFLIYHFSLSHAQTTAKRINEVKRDVNYLYAEATTKTAEEAILAAKSILEVKVGDWVRATHSGEGIEVCIAKAKEQTFEVQTRRGDYYRAFVYVKKSDILPISNKSEVVVFQVDTVSSEKPLITPQEAISEEAPIVEAAQALTLTQEEQKMTAITSFYDIEPYVKNLKAIGKLKAYGKYATMPTGSNCHLFVYDRQGNIIATLRKSPDRQYNLRTLKEDNIKNYINCGAIWLQLK